MDPSGSGSTTRTRDSGLASIVASIAILGVAIFWRAQYNLTHIDYPSSNFAFFWLSGRMILDGENPYDLADWARANAENDITWQPDAIFPYPLPLAVLLAPLGIPSLGTAYFGWQVLSGAVIALSVWSLLARRKGVSHQRMLIPIMLVLLFFGPVFLTLQIGALGAFMLAAVLAAITALEHEKPLLAGILLSLTLVKPPQALPILLLAAIWLARRRSWKSFAGLALGAISLLLIGLLRDPLWLWKFAGAGQAILHRNLGLQSNVFGLAFVGCSRGISCMWLIGGVAAFACLAACGLYLWRQALSLTPWRAFNWILPVAFISTFYLWSYDQVLYLIPVIWIIVECMDRTRSHLAAWVFLIVLVLTSFMALISQANTGSDIASLGTTLLILAGLTSFEFLGGASAPNLPQAPASTD